MQPPPQLQLQPPGPIVADTRPDHGTRRAVRQPPQKIRRQCQGILQHCGSSAESAITNILSNLITDLSHQVTNMGSACESGAPHQHRRLLSPPYRRHPPQSHHQAGPRNEVPHKLVLRLDTLEANMVTLGVEENHKDTDVVMQSGSNAGGK
ncbi:hypothetical protein HDU93_004031 [Gonapodya sp. JEL0774]|nr:hypothetical protein HDU93_004031 [Gonapodya sp. JEL0774]